MSLTVGGVWPTDVALVRLVNNEQLFDKFFFESGGTQIKCNFIFYIPLSGGAFFKTMKAMLGAKALNELKFNGFQKNVSVDHFAKVFSENAQIIVSGKKYILSRIGVDCPAKKPRWHLEIKYIDPTNPYFELILNLHLHPDLRAKSRSPRDYVQILKAGLKRFEGLCNHENRVQKLQEMTLFDFTRYKYSVALRSSPYLLRFLLFNGYLQTTARRSGLTAIEKNLEGLLDIAARIAWQIANTDWDDDITDEDTYRALRGMKGLNLAHQSCARHALLFEPHTGTEYEEWGQEYFTDYLEGGSTVVSIPFHDEAEIRKVSFCYANCQGLNFKGARFTLCDFTGADCRGAKIKPKNMDVHTLNTLLLARLDPIDRVDLKAQCNILKARSVRSGFAAGAGSEESWLTSLP